LDQVDDVHGISRYGSAAWAGARLSTTLGDPAGKGGQPKESIMGRVLAQSWLVSLLAPIGGISLA
jgi:hypothetical protein